MTPSTEHSGTLTEVHRTFASLAEASIRQMVIDGRLAPGERLNEVALANALDISRGPVREAIQRLASAGLLSIVSHHGAYVREFGRDELRDLYDLRIALETHAVRVGAKRATDEQVLELQRMLQATQQVLDQRAGAYPGDLDFHRRIVALAHNPSLTAAFDSALQQIELARARSSGDPARAVVALEDHVDVVRHLVARDGNRAATHLRRHLEGALVNALAVLDLVP